MTKVLEAFGLHQTIDGCGCDRAALGNLDLIHDFLASLPAQINMTPIMPPYVFKYHGKVPEDWGVSGFILIAESHISIHTFPEREYLSLDVFSCKDFNSNFVLARAAQVFGIQRPETQTFPRGLDFPRDIRRVERHLRQERWAYCGGGG